MPDATTHCDIAIAGGGLAGCLIALALALLQIATGWITYQQSTNLVRESKFSAAANLANGLVAAISDALVVKDYAAIESRMQQTMANQEVAEIWLINPAGKVLTGLKREGNATKVVFNAAASHDNANVAASAASIAHG